VSLDTIKDVSSITSPYTGLQGANLCYRYVNGQLTRQPLWPWPMNERITDAMRQSGRPPVDVTQTVQSLLGPVPFQCSCGMDEPPAGGLH